MAWDKNCCILGPAGVAGANGLDGAVGPQGPNGLDGAPGVQGPAGNDGAAGPQGLAGNDGAAGPQGLAGNDGAPGAQGPPGNDGAPGAQGPNGLDGAAGAQGPAGNDGAPGAPGSPGADSQVPGPQGPNGYDGAVGPQGPPGNDGAPGAQGPQGERGSDGTPGWEGPPGPQGPQGPAGSSGSFAGFVQGGLVTVNAGLGMPLPTWCASINGCSATCDAATNGDVGMSVTVNNTSGSGINFEVRNFGSGWVQLGACAVWWTSIHPAQSFVLDEEQAAWEKLHPITIDTTPIPADGKYVGAKTIEELRTEVVATNLERAEFIKNFKRIKPHQTIVDWIAAGNTFGLRQ